MTGCRRTCAAGDASHCYGRGGMRASGRCNVSQAAPALTDRNTSRLLLRQRLCLGLHSPRQKSINTSERRRTTRTQPCVVTHGAVHASSTSDPPYRDQANVENLRRSADVTNKHTGSDKRAQLSNVPRRGKAAGRCPQESGMRSLCSSQSTVTTGGKGTAIRQTDPRAGTAKALTLPKGTNANVVTPGKLYASAFCHTGWRHSASPNKGVSSSADTRPYRLQSSVSRSTQTERAHPLCACRSGTDSVIFGWSNSAAIKGAAEWRPRCGNGGYRYERSSSAPCERRLKSAESWDTTFRNSPQSFTDSRMRGATVHNQCFLSDEKKCERRAPSEIFQSSDIKDSWGVSASKTGRDFASCNAHPKTERAQRRIPKDCCRYLRKQCVHPPWSRGIAVHTAGVDEAQEDVSLHSDFALVSCSAQTRNVSCQVSGETGSDINRDNQGHGGSASVKRGTLQMIEGMTARQQGLVARDAIISILLQRCLDQEDRTRRLFLTVLAQLSEQKMSLLQQKQQLHRTQSDILALKATSARSSVTPFSSESSIHFSHSLRQFRSRSSTRCSFDNITNTISPAPTVAVESFDGTPFVVRGAQSSGSRSGTDSEASSTSLHRQHALANALVAWESEEEPRAHTCQANAQNITEFISLSDSEEDAPSHKGIRDKTIPPPLSKSSVLPAAPAVSCTSIAPQHELASTTENCRSTSNPTAKSLEKPPTRQLLNLDGQGMRIQISTKEQRVGYTSLSPVQNAEISRTSVFDSTPHDPGAVWSSSTPLQDQLVSINLASISAALNELVQCELSALSDRECPCCGMAGWTFSSVTNFTVKCLQQVGIRARTACEGVSSLCFHIAAVAFTRISRIVPHCRRHQLQICFSPYCPSCGVPAGAFSSPLFLMK